MEALSDILKSGVSAFAAGGGGSLTIYSVEVDFGNPAKCEKVFTVSHVGATASQSVIAVQSRKAATGKQADENDFDFLAIRAEPKTDQIVFSILAIPGPVRGKFIISYIIA